MRKNMGLFAALLLSVAGCSREIEPLPLPDLSSKASLWLYDPEEMTAEEKKGLYTHYLLFTDGKKVFWFDLDRPGYDTDYETDRMNSVLKKKGKPLWKY